MTRLAQILHDYGNPQADTEQGDQWVAAIAEGLNVLQVLGLIKFPVGQLTLEQIHDKLDYAAALGTKKYFESKKS